MLAGDAEPPQDLERARIDGVAAQLVAGKDRAIEQAYANPRARQQERRDRSGGTGACDEHLVTHRHAPPDDDAPHQARPRTIALFFDPNPRQLQSAASGSASRPVSGMKSMSHADRDP